MILAATLQAYVEAINSYLDRILAEDATPPDPIHRSMRYSLFAGGKRLRPLLAMASCEALGGAIERILPAAAAIEMVHTYSLIHDDLPCMDNDDFRRGKPTNHKVFGEAIAILAGDALLTAAFEHLSSSYPADISCRLIRLLAEAAGTRGLIGGQVLDITSESQPLTLPELDQLHRMKTGALIRFSTVAAPVVLKANQEVEKAFMEYGSCLGLTFQIIDDILDVESSVEMLGKTPGKDRKYQKATYPSLLGIDKSKERAKELTDRAIAIIKPYDASGVLCHLADHILNRKK